MEKIGYILFGTVFIIIVFVIAKKVKGKKSKESFVNNDWNNKYNSENISTTKDNFFALHHEYGEVPYTYNELYENEYILSINDKNIKDNKLKVYVPKNKKDEINSRENNRKNVLEDLYLFTSNNFDVTKKNMIISRKDEIFDWILDTPLGDIIKYMSDQEAIDTIITKSDFYISSVEVNSNWNIENIVCELIIKTDAKPDEYLNVKITYNLKDKKIEHLSRSTN